MLFATAFPLSGAWNLIFLTQGSVSSKPVIIKRICSTSVSPHNGWSYNKSILMLLNTLDSIPFHQLRARKIKRKKILVDATLVPTSKTLVTKWLQSCLLIRLSFTTCRKYRTANATPSTPLSSYQPKEIRIWRTIFGGLIPPINLGQGPTALRETQPYPKHDKVNTSGKPRFQVRNNYLADQGC